MLHTTDPKGTAGFITPLVMKGKGKDAVNVNNVGGNKFALNIAYIAIASLNIVITKNPQTGEPTVKDNRLTNITVRTAVSEIGEAIKVGNPADLFTLYDVKEYADRDSYGDLSKWAEIYTVTRGDLLKTCDEVTQIHAIMLDAEKKAEAIAIGHKSGVKQVGTPITYHDGATKAKRAGGKTFVSI